MDMDWKVMPKPLFTKRIPQTRMKVMVRMSPALHEALMKKAKQTGQSFNGYCVNILLASLDGETYRAVAANNPQALAILEPIKVPTHEIH